MQVMIKDDEIEAANLVRKQLTWRKGHQRGAGVGALFFNCSLIPESALHNAGWKRALAPEISLQCL
jgi:hypothetical protein